MPVYTYTLHAYAAHFLSVLASAWLYRAGLLISLDSMPAGLCIPTHLLIHWAAVSTQTGHPARPAKQMSCDMFIGHLEIVLLFSVRLCHGVQLVRCLSLRDGHVYLIYVNILASCLHVSTFTSLLQRLCGLSFKFRINVIISKKH